MAAYPLQELYRDIETLPSDKLAELQQFIDFLRFTLTSKANPTAHASLMQFAGCWQTMDDSVFDGFVEEIDERRRSAVTLLNTHPSPSARLTTMRLSAGNAGFAALCP